MTDRTEVVLIDHAKVVDGFGELENFSAYRPIETFCGVCDAPFTLSPQVQKYMLEVKSIPVKVLKRGAVYCVDCRRRRSRINWLKSGDGWRAEPRGKETLDELLQAELDLTRQSQQRYRKAKWPYRSDLGALVEGVSRSLGLRRKRTR